jgi:prepilin-type processing-associated H-X9-DG protein
MSDGIRREIRGIAPANDAGGKNPTTTQFMKSLTLKSFPSMRTGFRLASVFVLFAVAAFLIALLIPVIQRARTQSNLALCRDNLRKIGVSLRQYAQANGGNLPMSPTVENPHAELTHALASGGFTGDRRNFYCPSLENPVFTDQAFTSGVIGYYYYSASVASTDPTLSKFLRGGVTWPRRLNMNMDPKSWIMSDIWVSGLPTAHPGFRKGVNYLMLDGSVDFVGESPRQQFH